MDGGEQSVGWQDRGWVIWQVHNADWLSRGGVEPRIVALADGAGGGVAGPVSELNREDGPLYRFPTADGLLVDDDSLGGNAAPQQSCAEEQPNRKNTEQEQDKKEPDAQRELFFTTEHV